MSVSPVQSPRPTTGADVPPVVLERVGFGEAMVDYEVAWQLQRDVHAEVAAGSRPDTVLLVEHPPVYTAGKRTNRSDRPVDGSRVVDVDRGGRITWHGPGQLVGYPVVRLADPLHVVEYVRRVEHAVMAAVAELGVATVQVEGRSGVWVQADARGPERKLCAIGVRVAQGVTMHGFALNCNPDMSWFTRIVPCGIDDAGVTCLSWELGRDVTVQEALPVVERHLLTADLAGHDERARRLT